MIDIRDPQLYLDWSNEHLTEHIKMLRELQGKKLGIGPMPSKDRVKKMLSPDSDDFLGTGMSMHDFIIAGRLKDIQSNILMQTRPEMKRRMRLIIEMAAELKQILERTRFATALAEGAIEDVIRGDWNGLRSQATDFKFKDEHEDIQRIYGPIYARFSALCQEAFDTRPGAEELVPPPKN